MTMESGFLDGTTSVQPYDPSVDTPEDITASLAGTF